MMTETAINSEEQLDWVGEPQPPASPSLFFNSKNLQSSQTKVFEKADSFFLPRNLDHNHNIVQEDYTHD